MNRCWLITPTTDVSYSPDPESEVVYATEDAAYAAFGRMCQRLGDVGGTEIVERTLVGGPVVHRPSWLGDGPVVASRSNVEWDVDGFSCETSQNTTTQDVELARYVAALINADRAGGGGT